MRARDIILGLTALLAAAAFAAGYAWWQLEATLSLHGWIALGVGVGLTLLLAAGLVALMQYSHRRGYDDDAGHL